MAEQSEVSSPPEDVTGVTDNATVHSDSQTEEPKEESVCEEGKTTSCGVTEEVDTSRPVQQTEQLKKTTLFTPADLFRFRQLLVSTMEKLRRLETAEEKNESRIQELVVSNHTLNREKEDLLQQLKLKEQEYEQRLEDLRHECEDRLHRADVDKTSSEVKKKVTKEMQNRMKEELKQMQVKAYQQEKQISELQSQLVFHHNSSDVALAHWTQLDVRLKELGGQYLKAAESLARLERGVDFARQVAKGLSYQIRHQQCEMRERTGQLVSVREEVIALRAQVTSRPVESFHVEEMRAQVDGMSRRVEQLEREREELTKELSRQTQRAQEALSSSQRAHEQIARHLDNASQHRAESERLGKELKTMTSLRDSLKRKVAECQDLWETERECVRKEKSAWEDKERSLEEELRERSARLQSAEESRSNLERQNTGLGQTLGDVSRELDEAKAKLNVPRSDVSAQCGCSLSSLRDVTTQAQPDTGTSDTQTTPPATSHVSQQTHDVITSVAASQTVDPPVVHASAQTLTPQLVTRGSNPAPLPPPPPRTLMVPKYTQTTPTSVPGVVVKANDKAGQLSKERGHRDKTTQTESLCRDVDDSPDVVSEHGQISVREAVCVSGYNKSQPSYKTSFENRANENRLGSRYCSTEQMTTVNGSRYVELNRNDVNETLRSEHLSDGMLDASSCGMRSKWVWEKTKHYSNNSSSGQGLETESDETDFYNRCDIMRDDTANSKCATVEPSNVKALNCEEFENEIKSRSNTEPCRPSNLSENPDSRNSDVSRKRKYVHAKTTGATAQENFSASRDRPEYCGGIADGGRDSSLRKDDESRDKNSCMMRENQTELNEVACYTDRETRPLSAETFNTLSLEKSNSFIRERILTGKESVKSLSENKASNPKRNHASGTNEDTTCVIETGSIGGNDVSSDFDRRGFTSSRRNTPTTLVTPNITAFCKREATTAAKRSLPPSFQDNRRASSSPGRRSNLSLKHNKPVLPFHKTSPAVTARSNVNICKTAVSQIGMAADATTSRDVSQMGIATDAMTSRDISQIGRATDAITSSRVDTPSATLRPYRTRNRINLNEGKDLGLETSPVMKCGPENRTMIPARMTADSTHPPAERTLQPVSVLDDVRESSRLDNAPTPWHSPVMTSDETVGAEPETSRAIGDMDSGKGRPTTYPDKTPEAPTTTNENPADDKSRVVIKKEPQDSDTSPARQPPPVMAASLSRATIKTACSRRPGGKTTRRPAGRKHKRKQSYEPLFPPNITESPDVTVAGTQDEEEVARLEVTAEVRGQEVVSEGKVEDESLKGGVGSRPLKGILKGPQTGKKKCVNTKSVTFPEILEQCFEFPGLSSCRMSDVTTSPSNHKESTPGQAPPPNFKTPPPNFKTPPPTPQILHSTPQVQSYPAQSPLFTAQISPSAHSRSSSNFAGSISSLSVPLSSDSQFREGSTSSKLSSKTQDRVSGTTDAPSSSSSSSSSSSLAFSSSSSSSLSFVSSSRHLSEDRGIITTQEVMTSDFERTRLQTLSPAVMEEGNEDLADLSPDSIPSSQTPPHCMAERAGTTNTSPHSDLVEGRGGGDVMGGAGSERSTEVTGDARMTSPLSKKRKTL